MLETLMYIVEKKIINKWIFYQSTNDLKQAKKTAEAIRGRVVVNDKIIFSIQD